MLGVVDGNTAARHQFGKDRELKLTRACLLRNAPPVENRRWHQHRKPFGQGQRHQQLLGKAAATSPRRRAAEQRDELAPFHHSITLSARARNAGGTVKPSALAVLRLMTNSNMVGCSTGRSAGWAPFRILSTQLSSSLGLRSFMLQFFRQQSELNL